MKFQNLKYLVGILSVAGLTSCNKEKYGDIDISVLATYFDTPNTSFTINETTIVITSTAEPDHKSAYYDVSHPLYEAYSATDFNQNPNSIVAQTITMTVPRYPAEASSHEATPYGSMGIAVNSVSLYNQYAAPGDDLSAEIETFDQWEGHPQQQGNYHYHLEPIWLSQDNGNEALVGVLLDGFPVYGTYENGVQITNSDLDEYHGHFGATADFPDGIYHYHVTSEDPYINGNGFYGTAGTISN
jgi:hypothetical protein